MKDFLKLMRQYASPYKGHLAGAVVLNILSAVFNIFSFVKFIFATPMSLACSNFEFLLLSFNY